MERTANNQICLNLQALVALQKRIFPINPALTVIVRVLMDCVVFLLASIQSLDVVNVLEPKQKSLNSTCTWLENVAWRGRGGQMDPVHAIPMCRTLCIVEDSRK